MARDAKAGTREYSRPLRAHLTQPGTAEISCDGTITLAASDLAHVNMTGACSLHIHAYKHTLSVRHGNDHRLVAVASGGPGASIEARRELIAIGIDLEKATTAQVIRHNDDGCRWIELRFIPDVLVQRAMKNKTASGGTASGGSPRKREEREGAHA